MTEFSVVRTIRTPSSERFLLRRANGDVGAVDFHYLGDASVSATLTLTGGGEMSDDEVSALLTYLDVTLLPDVSLDERNLTFTVVVGRLLGDFQAERTTAHATIKA